LLIRFYLKPVETERVVIIDLVHLLIR
jgi:hypothetical protein